MLHDLTLPERILEAAHRSSHFLCGRVVIEITESALLENLQHAQAISMELKTHGCRLALDDFGTGYSSLLHLQSLPFDGLKVDRSFVELDDRKSGEPQDCLCGRRSRTKPGLDHGC